MNESAPVSQLDAAPVSSVELLDELEELIGEARHLPFSSKVLVSEEHALEIVDRARMGLPQEVVRAHDTNTRRERILSAAEQEAAILQQRSQQEAQQLVESATQEAERLARDAQQQAAQLLDQHSITVTAETRATELVADAEERAASIHEEADAYAREVMEELESNLSRALATVRKGLSTLPAARHKK